MGDMYIRQSLFAAFLIAPFFFLSACTVDKLEARLQANPECRSIMNSKTGVLMPCPGSDKEFYRSLATLTPDTSPASGELVVKAPVSVQAGTPKFIAAPVECKPQLHQKSGSWMPCPTP